jgi:hypothetical protein
MKLIYTLTFIILAISLLWAGAVITEWTADPQENKVILQWKTSLEDEVEKFVIERSTDNSHFFNIGEVSARGAGFQYRFEDNKLGLTNSIFYYRLRIVNDDGSFQYTETCPAIPNISSISQSWGSIKALFR